MTSLTDLVYVDYFGITIACKSKHNQKAYTAQYVVYVSHNLSHLIDC